MTIEKNITKLIRQSPKVELDHYVSPAVNAALTLIGLIALVSPYVSAQGRVNHARGKPYRVEPAPLSRYADDKGAQPYTPDAFYLGELTDGVVGQPNYRAPQWVGWRDTNYREPIRMTIDLGKPTWIDRIEVTACGGGKSIEPPQRIDVAVRSGSFPYDAFVQIGQIARVEQYVQGPAKIYHFVMDACPCTARQVRLSFEERTWSYLFVDEIKILGGPKGKPSILPVQDIVLEAEQCRLLGGRLETIKGSVGSSALLSKPGDALRLDLPLPAGDYTIRVRSLAKKPDTFSELVPRIADQSMRAQPVTNNVFTWQRSHFTQQKDGPAHLSLTLTEGAGVYVDRLRIHLLTLNEPIKKLKDFASDTTLIENGKPRCMIVMDDAAKFEAQAESLADAIEKRAGAPPPLKRGTEATEEDFRSRHIVALGDKRNNFAILKASPNAWNHIPSAPTDGGAQLFVAVDPKGAGTNVVVIGGADVGQLEKSKTEFLKRLTGQKTLVLPWTMIPPPKLTINRERYKDLAVESSKWIRQSAIRRLENQWKAYSDDVFLMLGYRYIEYKDSFDTIRQVSRDGFIEAELFKILCRFDRSEHNGSFSRLQRLQLTNTLLAMSRQCASIFDWVCCGRSYHPPDKVTEILSNRKPTIANNHQTFPTYSILTAGDYFSKYYGLPEAKRWLRWADMFMQGQLITSKPQCDCWGYHDITMIHTARYAAAIGRWDYFNQDPVHQFLRLRFISHDNLGGGVGYGDVGAYQTPHGTDFKAENAQRWTEATGGRFDLNRVAPQKLLGVYVHPLEPMWYELNGKEAKVALQRSFDKISFRNAIDPQRAYLLLDGLSRGYHGHWDGNSILRFTDNGRLWLCEGDYLKGDPKDHNTMTFMRDGESARPGIFSSLEAKFESPAWGVTITRTPDYCGLDWDRHILWHRPTDTFVLIDEMTAKASAAFDMKRRFRSLGETQLSGRVWRVEQEGGERFYLHSPADGTLAEASDPEDAKNWKNYSFADPTPKLLRHRLAREMKRGDRAALFCMFYAAGAAEPIAAVRSLSESAIVVNGQWRGIVGVRELSRPEMRIRAAQFVVGPESLLIVKGTEASADRPLLKASAPLSIAIDLDAGEGTLEAGVPTRLSIAADAERAFVLDSKNVTASVSGVIELNVNPGRHTFKGGFSHIAKKLSAAYERAWSAAKEGGREAPPKPTRGIQPLSAISLPAEITTFTTGDISGDGVAEILAACSDGTVAAVDSSGRELWRHKFTARVNDLTTADLDGDGKDEIICGVEDEHLHVLKPDGSELWKRFFEAQRSQGGIEGHVRCVLAADFEGDGSPEIAVGCANSMFYVLDKEGKIKQSNGQQWEVLTQHKASAIGAADVTGDGQLELLAGYTYFGRKIVDFADTSRLRVSNIGGCISGCFAITSADVDGDGRPEAIFADKDGQITACRKSKPKPGTRGAPADIVWKKIIGDDAISKVLSGDFDGDAKPEIIVASHSGFLALLDAKGSVVWIRYAQNQVTDAALVESPNAAASFARSSTDGSVAIYNIKGDEIARWRIGSPVQRILAARGDKNSLLVAAVGDNLKLALVNPE